VAQALLKKATDKEGKPLRGRFNLRECVNSYIGYLRGLLAGGSGSGNDAYHTARTRRMSAQATLEEMRLRRVARELLYAGDVEFVWTNAITAARSRLLAVPSRACPTLRGETDLNKITRVLTDKVELALRELSTYDPAAFAQANQRYLDSIGVAKPEGQANGNGSNGQEGTSLSSEPAVDEAE
jgi:hypothetical protein